MRLADDERARVPFALVGVVLLLASTGYATVLATREPPVDQTRVDRAVERTQTEVRLALARATVSAGRAAAAEPVQVAGDGPYGQVLADAVATGAGGHDDGGPRDVFGSSLRLRTYLAARESLAAVETEIGAITVDASLASVDSPADASQAIDRVDLEAVNRTRLRAEIRGVTLTIRRGGRIVDRVTYSPAAVAPTAVLSLHRRTARYEARLNRGPTEGPGLGRQVTPLLYAMAWGRGYAQYAREPVANVLANRHVELATNLGVAGVQRTTFGRVDPDYPVELGEGFASVAARDYATDLRENLEGRAVERAPNADAADLTLSMTDSLASSTGADDPMPVDVNVTADRAFADFVGRDGSPTFGAVLRSAYAARVDLDADVRRVDHSVETRGDRPPANWTRIGATVDRDRWIADVSGPRTSASGRTLATYAARVVTERERTTWWTNGTAYARTDRTTTTVDRVTLDVDARRASGRYVPSRPAGLLDGASRDAIRERAVDRLVADRGGAAALAERAVAGGFDGASRSVHAPVPDRVRDRAYWDLARLRDRVRDRSVSVPRHDVATDANPARTLATRLDRDRARLHGSGASAPAVASAAVRTAYLDRVVSRLTDRGGALSRTQDALAGALADHGVSPELPKAPLESGAAPGIAGIEGSPTYLSLSASRPADGDPFYPLAARNLNLFTVPYGDAGDAIAEAVVGDPPARVSLESAARTLQAAERADGAEADLSRRDRTRLRGAIAASFDRVEVGLARELAATTTGTPRAEATATVRDAAATWPTVQGRALAAANGSLAAAVAREAAPRDAATRDLLETRLRAASERLVAERGVRVSEAPVRAVDSGLREQAGALVADAAAHGVKRGVQRARRRALARSMASLPAGLPLAPVPGSWYATANVWIVSIRGGYERFTVASANATAASDLTYVREAGTAALDVDGDGERERLGRTTPIEFATDTAVVVVVPPGGQGVGDADGTMDERSAGWGERD